MLMIILLLVDYEVTVKEACMMLKNSAKQMELAINQEKTKCMELSLFWFRPCAACECLKRLIVFTTLVTP
jgi:hypothetical protein